MATSPEYIEFVCEQLKGTGEVRYRKMFGEYMAYVNNKPILLVCDNTVYIKKLDEIKDLMADAETGVPYQGSKEHYILDIENVELVRAVMAIIEPIMLLPKPRKKSKNRPL